MHNLKILVDDEIEADKYPLLKRSIRPKVYSDAKKRRANKENKKVVEMHIEDEDEPENQIKEALRAEIAAKISAVNNLYIDLSEEEIDKIQDVFDESSDDDEVMDLSDASVHFDDRVESAASLTNDSEENIDFHYVTENSTNASDSDIESNSSNIPIPMNSKIEVIDSSFSPSSVCIQFILYK